MVWAALIIGVCSGVGFLGSVFVLRLEHVKERLLDLWNSFGEKRVDPRAARALGQRLGAFGDLREELLQRARRAGGDGESFDAELEAFRRVSDRFLELADRELRKPGGL